MIYSKFYFINREPSNKEWSSHVQLLNKYTNPDQRLRHIIQYARSGPHHPADMHADLIEQIINSHIDQTKLDMAQAYYDMGRNDPFWMGNPLPKSVLKVLPNYYRESTADVSRGKKSFMDFMLSVFRREDNV